MKTFIIDASAKLPHWRVFLEAALAVVLTLAVWAILIFGIAAQLLGEKRMQSLAMFALLFVVAVIIFILFVSWQYYNWHRFHGKDRRKAFKAQSLAEVGALYGIGLEDMEKLQSPFRQASVFYKEGQYFYQVPGAEPIPIRALDERKNT